MKTGKINLVYFSPTGSTKNILQFIGKSAGIQAAEFDYTDYGNREIKPIPFKPHATSRCKKCGACVKACPVNAISEDNPKLTDKDKCISCMRCVRVCPDRSRKLRRIELWMAKKILSKQCKTEKQPEIFI